MLYEVFKVVRGRTHQAQRFKHLFAQSVGMLYTKDLDQIAERLRFLVPSMAQDLLKLMDCASKPSMAVLFELDSFLALRKSLRS
jgi:hypothetical protein